MPKLTKRLVEGLQPRPAEYIVWDSETAGFGVRVSPKGVRSYLVKYRAGPQQRKTRLGRHGAVTVDEARKKARELLGRVAGGEDPGREIVERRWAPTVAELCERFLAEHVETRCKPKTAVDYRLSIRRIVDSPLGGIKVQDVDGRHVAELHHAMRKSPYLANRTLAVLSKMFNLAKVWGLRPGGSNPCEDIDRYHEEQRERFLSPAEFGRLGEALEAFERERPEMRPAVNAVRLLILTGCRLSEIQTLKWDYIRGNLLALPDSKTRKNRRRYLGPAALDVLSRIERLPENPYVIIGRLPGQHLTDLQRPWRRIRARAGLSDVRIHDLRHSFASAAATAGEGLLMIGKLLGHTQVQTTARYAHLADDPVQAAAARISDGIAAVMNGGSRTVLADG